MKKVKMQKSPSKFHHFSFQFSKFKFYHFNLLSFIYPQLSPSLTVCKSLQLSTQKIPFKFWIFANIF